jgi:hypothetical protein
MTELAAANGFKGGSILMSKDQSYDAGHFSFLELIKVMLNVAGPEFAKGNLIRTGMSAAKRMPEQAFESWDELLRSIEDGESSISLFEGRARHYEDGIFGLTLCPFADSIKTYTRLVGGLPEEFQEVSDAMNTRSRITQQLRIGEGAAVSPFCSVHQPIRSEIGRLITVSGQQLLVYQLGCKSGSGDKAIAESWCQETGVDTAFVDKVLDDNMCCYCIRLAPLPEPD